MFTIMLLHLVVCGMVPLKYGTPDLIETTQSEKGRDETDRLNPNLSDGRGTNIITGQIIWH